MIGAVLTRARATPDKRPMRIAYIINSLERGGAAFRGAASAGSLRRCGTGIRFKQPVRVW